MIKEKKYIKLGSLLLTVLRRDFGVILTLLFGLGVLFCIADSVINPKCNFSEIIRASVGN